MSATNRGADRMPEDAYPTPAWCVHRLLEGYPGLPKAGTWLEPCAGDGAIVRVVRSVLGDAVRIHTVDVRDTRDDLERAGVDRAAMHVGSYLDWQPHGFADVIITNPPFSLALPIIKKALTEAAWVLMLLRLNFLGSSERSGWLRNEMPDLCTLPDRPNYVASYKCRPRDAHDRGCGWHAMLPIAAEPIRACPTCGRKVQRSTSDSAEYAWFCWGPERGRSHGQTIILASTPEAERKAA